MRVLSTRGGAAAALTDAIGEGLAPDGGLYLPERPLPALGPPPETLDLAAVARWLLAPFFTGEPLERELETICQAAFAFDAPLVALDERSALLELFHGPTAAFKDFGARFLAECLQRTTSRARTRCVLVATSGDTGAAVAAAFHGRPRFQVEVLYPDGRVSPRQAHQLGAFGGNVRAWRVAGSFDDCQRLVKAAFADEELRDRLALTSANSISLGRLLPQMAYWAKAALLVQREGRGPAHLVVPTGNLGNAFACLLARELGLPIGQVCLATNANRVLPDLLASGRYEPRASVPTLANAMDVGAPSNVERLLAWWPDQASLARCLTAESVTDEEIRSRIRRTWESVRIAVCPHTACALEVLARRRACGVPGFWIAGATAHSAKFETIVEPLIGARVAPPPGLAALLSRPSHALPLVAEAGALRAALRGARQAARRGGR